MAQQDRKQALVVEADGQIDAAIMAVLSPEEWQIQHAEDNATAL